MSGLRSLLVMSMARVLILAAAMPASAAGGSLVVTAEAHCGDYEAGLTEDGDAAHRTGEACTQQAAARTSEGPGAAANLNRSRESTRFEAPDGSHTGSYDTESVRLTLAPFGQKALVVEGGREKGHTDLQEGGRIEWEETRAAVTAAGETVRVIGFVIENDRGERCGLVIQAPVDGEDHGANSPSREACQLLG
ncbi:MAG TPA: hypothetical protein VNZ52_03715 [Candidatus Thermoplasmatota archaeon]|nr:hypothetical protein [Candidatus Thermoplasmatota archaeon]